MPIGSDNSGSSAFVPTTSVEVIDSSSAPEPASNEVAEVSQEGAASTTAPPAPDLSREARKLFLSAQKSDRQASERLSKTKASTQRAEAIDAALANLDKDPTALLKAAGIDSIKYYQKLTQHHLNGDPAPDPVQERLSAQEAKLKAVAEHLEFQKQELQEQADLNAKITAVGQHVLPILQRDMDSYESILAYNGDDPNAAAVYIFNAVEREYDESVKRDPNNPNIVSFQDAANALEKYHSDQLELGITKAMSMKKFSAKYGNRLAPAENTDALLGHTDEPKRPATLTSNHSKVVTQPSKKSTTREQSIEDRIAKTLSKF